MKKAIITKKEIKVEAKGSGMNGRIVVQTHGFHKVIPAVLFSSREAEALLRIVDKVENELKIIMR